MSPPDARQRAAETKRRRTRGALLVAAAELFAQRGWHGTRIEDIAKVAGVSAATAYNHFKNKQALMGHVYAPLAKDLIKAAERDVARMHPPLLAVRRHVHDLADLARRHRDLTVSLVAAIQEQTMRTGAAAQNPDDVRVLVPLADPLITLIGYGQRDGVFKTEPPATESGTYHTSALLYRVLSRPHETPHETASVVLSQLLPALTADSEGPTEWSPDDDLSHVLKRLVGGVGAGTAEERRRLANSALTREYLEAGFRLLARECMPSGDGGPDRSAAPVASVLFDLLSVDRVMAEVDRAAGRKADEKSFHERWRRRDDYVDDALSYALWVKHWWPQAIAAERAAAVLAGTRDVAQAAHEASYQDLVTGLSNPATRISLVTAAVADRHPQLKESLGEVYQVSRERWLPVYERTLVEHGVALRPGIGVRDIADIFTALSDGLVLRTFSDPSIEFIDHEQRRTLLGKAVLAVVIGCADPGDGREVEDVIRDLFDRPAAPGREAAT
jgi:AcrR family transcriptional regulator